MRYPAKFVAVCAAALVLTGCGGNGFGGRRPQTSTQTGVQNARNTERAAEQKLLAGYDTNKDGSLSRAELEAGLKRDFDALDKNHDGKLSGDEVREENDRRWKQAGPQSTPLIDWNHDGYVDFDEYATATRTLFDQLDVNHDGVLTPQEMRGPRNGADQNGVVRRRGLGGAGPGSTPGD
jgi:Ca2+-binding EF-hand superfamily protein